MNLENKPAVATKKPLAPPAVKYKNGQVEAKIFRELDVFERQQFVNLLCEGKTPELVMLCVGESREWMKSIDFACYLELARYFINSNFHWALEIATHDLIMGLKVGPLMMEMGRVYELLPSMDSAGTSAIDLPNGSVSSTTPALAASAAPTAAPA